MPSIADDVLADTIRADFALAASCKNGLDFESFTPLF